VVDAPSRPRRSFGADVVHSTATLVVVALASAATGVLAARLLGPTGRGQLAAVMQWPDILGALATLGMSESLVYLCAREPHRSGRLLGTSLVVAVAASFAFAAGGWVLLPYLLHDAGADVVDAARWYLWQAPIGAVLFLAARPLRGVGDIRMWNYLRASHTFVWLAVLVTAGLRGSPTPAGIALSFLIGRALLVPVTLAIVRWRLHQRLRPERALAGGLLRYGLPNTLATIPNILNLRLDQLLLAALFPARDLGLYVAAVAWTSASTPLLVGFTTVFFPRVAELHDAAQQAALAARGTRLAVVVTTVVAGAVAVAAPWAVPFFFGAAYADAVPAAVILCVAAGVLGLAGVLQESARGLGQPTALLYGQLAGLAVTLVGLAVLLPRYGTVGAALASGAGYSGVVVYLARANARATGLPVRRHLAPTLDDLRDLVEQARRLLRPSPVKPRP
jgi:O-antigen/teichoic acid export membrane protein